MSYSIDAITDGCYENTTCLINKFDIRDEEKLKKVEADITFAKATILESNPISDKFDLEHYKAIHRFLFEDIYVGQAHSVRLIWQRKVQAFALQINLMMLQRIVLADWRRIICFPI